MCPDTAGWRDPLAAVGFRGADTWVYQTALTYPGLTPDDLAAIAGMSAKTTWRAVRRLVRARLLTISDAGQVQPVSPDLAISRLVTERQHDLEHARLVLADLAAGAYRPPRRRSADVIDGAEAVRETLADLTTLATSTLRIAHAYRDSSLPPAPPTLAVHRLVSRTAAETGDMPHELEAAVARGETVAIINDPPCGIAIADHDRAALIDHDRTSLILLTVPTVVYLITIAFDALASTAAEISPAEEVADLDPVDQRLLQLLAAGLKDDAVARHLGLSSRTVVRRVDRLTRHLGVNTRFQAGAAARARGWI